MKTKYYNLVCDVFNITKKKSCFMMTEVFVPYGIVYISGMSGSGKSTFGRGTVGGICVQQTFL